MNTKENRSQYGWIVAIKVNCVLAEDAANVNVVETQHSVREASLMKCVWNG